MSAENDRISAVLEAIQKLLRKFVKLTTAREETERLQEMLQEEIPELKKDLSLNDMKKMDVYRLKQVQLDLCPQSLEEYDRDLDSVRQKLTEETHKAGALLEECWASDNAKLLDVAIRAVKPFCYGEDQARSIAEGLPAISQFAAGVKAALYEMTPETKARAIVELLSRHAENGTLIPENLLALVAATPARK